MNAAVVHKLGNTPQCDEFPEPVADENEIVVQVLAASLKPVDKQMASGSHYAAPRKLPFICGTDGVGRLADGQRVFFGGCRPPYGAMAQRTVVPKAFIFPVPAGLDDALAAALPNPGVSAWLSLTHRAKLASGENVLILGATGITGQLAVKIARLLGAGRVVAAGRNQQVLQSLLQNGADAIIRLDDPVEEVKKSFLKEAGESGFQVVIDYVWGQPTETFLSAIAKESFAAVGTETRLVQAGESAGPNISLPAAVLRSTALTILGTAGIPPGDVLVNALKQVMAHAADGKLHVPTTRIPLASIGSAWEGSQSSSRMIIIP
ncbi:MAG TPA: zinc-binding alcohol dehydrogenase family protein [Candidatus Angelobacter sp.]|nr:zinc-binding alcohol dehydrogenase family protein [Candidatus Angelobacter sp.]